VITYTYLSTWIFGGIGSGVVLMMEEFNKDLNSTVTGLISWGVLALGLAVRNYIHPSDDRTSFGLLSLSTSANDLFSF
jgi:hypothetical protein